VKKWRKDLDDSREKGVLPATAPRFVPATILVWLASSVFGYFVTWGIPSVNSLLLSMVLYIIVGKLGLVRGVGESRTVAGAEQELVAQD
jgi:cytosine permease